jgi:hypothetical protein
MVMVTYLANLSAAARTASSRMFYKMVCVLYNVLSTIYLTKLNLPEQYLTQEAAPGYGCDERVTRDIGHANFNHPPTTSTTTQSKCIRYVLSFNPSLLTSIYRIQALFPGRNHPNALKVSPYPHLELTKEQPQTPSPAERMTRSAPGRLTDATTIKNCAHHPQK